MDGAPIKSKNFINSSSDETIPIRFFLSPYDLTPTYPSVNNRFSTTYFINCTTYLMDI